MRRWDRARPWLLPGIVLAGGAAFRAMWIVGPGRPRWATAEIAQAAIAFASTGTVADAYLPGQGPTAHVNPITPAIAGMIYRLCGVRSGLSEAILATVAVIVTMASFTFLYRAFGRLGTPRWARLLALAACCFMPLYQGMETSEFRIWEGGWAVLLASGYLLALMTIEDRGKPIGGLEATAMALLAALTLFIAPAFGLAAYAAGLLSMIATVPARRWVPLGMLAAGALALIVMPWALRNAAALGSPVLLRSNFGLELAMGYDPLALNAAERAVAFHARQELIHPFNNHAAFTRMRAAGGEVAYARLLGEQTKVWMRAHPADAAHLTAEHLRDYLFPTAWELRLYYQPSALLPARRIALWIVSTLALLGAAMVLARRERRWLYPLLMVAAPTALYTLTQPILRYHYLIFALSLFFGAEAIATMARRLQARGAARLR